jgi:hypothetical protein
MNKLCAGFIFGQVVATSSQRNGPNLVSLPTRSIANLSRDLAAI